MSEQKVELQRRFVEAFNARDIDAMIGLCDPHIEFHSAFAAVGGASYHGHTGMRQWHRDLEEAWGEIRLEPEAYFDLGDQMLGFYSYHGRGHKSGAQVAMPAANISKWRNDRMIYTKVYMKRDEALRDVGVSEEELEPIAP